MTLNFLKLQLAVIFIWVFLFTFNGLFNNLIHHTDYIAIIFLPAGFKITIACLFGKRIFWGLFFGTVATGLMFIDEALIKNILMIGLLSAASPVLTVWLVNSISPLGKNLEHLNVYRILSIAACYALVNSFLHNTYLLMVSDYTFEKYQADSLLMFTGDALGSLIFLFIASYFRKDIFKYVDKWIL